MTTGYADHCEEPVQGDAPLVLRQCRGRGLRIVQGPGGDRKVLCATHSLKAYPSGWLVDWEASGVVFGTRRSPGRLADGIDRGQW